jgi:putative hydrolase of the HAD superfamily
MPEKKIKHVFFDLDRTLWDYETNCRAALKDIYTLQVEGVLPCGFESFYNTFQHENHKLWAMFSTNRVTKEQLRRDRFKLTFLKLGLNDEVLPEQVEASFLQEMPARNTLFPGAHEVLMTLSQHYELHILTNGFDEVQEHKLSRAGIRDFFRHVITSDLAGARKPSAEMFDFALRQTGAGRHNSLMIGDDPFVDIEGAKKSGIRGILYNTSGISHSFNDLHEVGSLHEIPDAVMQLERAAN